MDTQVVGALRPTPPPAVFSLSLRAEGVDEIREPRPALASRDLCGGQAPVDPDGDVRAALDEKSHHPLGVVDETRGGVEWSP